jgi:hypothetical protein
MIYVGEHRGSVTPAMMSGIPQPVQGHHTHHEDEDEEEEEEEEDGDHSDDDDYVE